MDLNNDIRFLAEVVLSKFTDQAPIHVETPRRGISPDISQYEILRMSITRGVSTEMIQFKGHNSSNELIFRNRKDLHLPHTQYITFLGINNRAITKSNIFAESMIITQ